MQVKILLNIGMNREKNLQIEIWPLLQYTLLNILFLSAVLSVSSTANYVKFRCTKVEDCIYFTTQKFVYLALFSLTNG